jgi:hypothetical protein
LIFGFLSDFLNGAMRGPYFGEPRIAKKRVRYFLTRIRLVRLTLREVPCTLMDIESLLLFLLFFFGGPELCTPGARVGGYFSGIPEQRFDSKFFQAGHVSTGAHWLLWGADTISGFGFKELFDYAVFQTVEAYYSKPSA